MDKCAEKVPYREGAESTVRHLGHYYQVDELLAIAETKPIQWMALSHFRYLLYGQTLDPVRVERTNTVYPLIVLKCPGYDWVVLDGMHRVQKALNQDRTQIMVRVITEKELYKTKL